MKGKPLHRTRPKQATFVDQLHASNLCGNRLKTGKSMGAATSAGTGTREQPPREQARASDHCRTRSEQATSKGAGQSQGHQGSRPESVTSASAGLSQQPLPKQARASDNHWSRPESVTSTGPRARNLCRTRPRTVTSAGAGPSQ